MRIVRPATIADANLTSSNVPETAPATYNGGTTYALGDQVSTWSGTVATVYESLQNANTGHTPASSPTWWQEIGTTYEVYNSGTTYAVDQIVISTTTHHEYQSLANSNVGHSLSDATWWLDLGSNNRWRMFDQSNTSQTTNYGEIEVALTITGRADAVSLLNINATTVHVVAETMADGVFYDQTFELVSDSGIDSWYEYFFEPIVRRGDLVIYDIPAYADPTITITLTQPGGTAEIATCVVGQSRDIGILVYGAKIGIQDYSRKEADDFGNFQIVERSFAKRATFKVWMDNDKIDAVAALLAQYRAIPVVYIGVDDFASTYIHGFYKDWNIEISFPTKSYCNFEIEGLT